MSTRTDGCNYTTKNGRNPKKSEKIPNLLKTCVRVVRTIISTNSLSPHNYLNSNIISTMMTRIGTHDLFLLTIKNNLTKTYETIDYLSVVFSFLFNSKIMFFIKN